MAYGSVNADLMTTSDGVSSSGLYGFKNRLINGAMVIDQRNAGAATANTINGYVLDRWQVIQSTTGKLIAQQNAGAVTPPVGFSNYFGVTSQSAYSIGSGDYYFIVQYIEGFNFADMAWGTANASAITISFWVRSSLTGTFGGSLRNATNARSYPFTYTISSANTWTQVSVTIAGDTSGTWVGATNGIGVQIILGLGVGSTYSGTSGAWAAANYIGATGATSVVGTNGATFYLTGVQLEKGSTATSFDYRPYSAELSLCQRYLPAFTAISGTTGPLPGIATALTTNVNLIFNHPVPARVPGTGVTVSSNSHFTFSNNDGNSASTAVSFAAGSPNATQLAITVASSRGVVTTPGWFYANNASAILYITGCEL